MNGISYTDLKTFCDRENITYQEFGAMVSPSGEISWQTVYRAITGRMAPGKRSRRVLDRFIGRNRKRIERALNGGEYHQAV